MVCREYRLTIIRRAIFGDDSIRFAAMLGELYHSPSVGNMLTFIDRNIHCDLQIPPQRSPHHIPYLTETQIINVLSRPRHSHDRVLLAQQRR